MTKLKSLIYFSIVTALSVATAKAASDQEQDSLQEESFVDNDVILDPSLEEALQGEEFDAERINKIDNQRWETALLILTVTFVSCGTIVYWFYSSQKKGSSKFGSLYELKDNLVDKISRFVGWSTSEEASTVWSRMRTVASYGFVALASCYSLIRSIPLFGPMLSLGFIYGLVSFLPGGSTFTQKTLDTVLGVIKNGVLGLFKDFADHGVVGMGEAMSSLLKGAYGVVGTPLLIFTAAVLLRATFNITTSLLGVALTPVYIPLVLANDYTTQGRIGLADVVKMAHNNSQNTVHGTINQMKGAVYNCINIPCPSPCRYLCSACCRRDHDHNGGDGDVDLKTIRDDLNNFLGGTNLSFDRDGNIEAELKNIDAIKGEIQAIADKLNPIFAAYRTSDQEFINALKDNKLNVDQFTQQLNQLKYLEGRLTTLEKEVTQQNLEQKRIEMQERQLNLYETQQNQYGGQYFQQVPQQFHSQQTNPHGPLYGAVNESNLTGTEHDDSDSKHETPDPTNAPQSTNVVETDATTNTGMGT
jgi:hypothetical protein